jgi:hypothetical protein
MEPAPAPARLPLGTSRERQNEEQRGQPWVQAHCAEIALIRLGSLFLTLPTRVLTGQHRVAIEAAAD